MSCERRPPSRSPPSTHLEGGTRAWSQGARRHPARDPWGKPQRGLTVQPGENHRHPEDIAEGEPRPGGPETIRKQRARPGQRGQAGPGSLHRHGPEREQRHVSRLPEKRAAGLGSRRAARGHRRSSGSARAGSSRDARHARPRSALRADYRGTRASSRTGPGRSPHRGAAADGHHRGPRESSGAALASRPASRPTGQRQPPETRAQATPRNDRCRIPHRGGCRRRGTQSVARRGARAPRARRVAPVACRTTRRSGRQLGRRAPRTRRVSARRDTRSKR